MSQWSVSFENFGFWGSHESDCEEYHPLGCDVSCGVVSEVCFQSITVSITLFFHGHTVTCITSHAYGAHILCGRFQSTVVTQV